MVSDALSSPPSQGYGWGSCPLGAGCAGGCFFGSVCPSTASILPGSLLTGTLPFSLAGQYENPLNNYIHHYEGLSYDTDVLHNKHQRVRRALSHEDKFLHLDFHAHGRSVCLLLAGKGQCLLLHMTQLQGWQPLCNVLFLKKCLCLLLAWHSWWYLHLIYNCHSVSVADFRLSWRKLGCIREA